MIRALTVEELPQVVPMFHDYYASSTVPHQFADAELQTFLAGILTRQQGALLVAESAGQLAGFALLYLTYETRAMKPLTILNDLFVAAPFRQQGLARALTAASGDWAKAQGCAEMNWQTRTTNLGAQHLYDQVATREAGWIHYAQRLD
ncbi:GNAT family N-acetyltransferase [Lacticaseibacillus suibinensis]|uniref:GNAT family N-acetyltransferase n=1 Tax=Lacticaseibacillus suibinensis TaxID=2486011 RepID=UPI000F7784BD|nr:GNAT family N-acetyltransferase [Lacticaseibacillus suibinensis]